MNRYFTIMVVPEREKGVKSFRIPRVLFHSLLFLGVALLFLIGILIYDYTVILKQVHENKHLTIENRQLKEQIQLFQMKINSLTEDIERIHTFERKLRVITGLETLEDLESEEDSAKNQEKEGRETSSTNPLRDSTSMNTSDDQKGRHKIDHNFESIQKKLHNPKEYKEYESLKNLYEQKIATNLGLQTGYTYTKDWNKLTKQSFSLAERYAAFDFKYNVIRNFVKELEIDVHKLDQYLLDKESLLKSTPTILPARGWITSYYGPRKSPYSGRVKMHEGLDVGARSGTPIVAPADGMVTYSGKKMGFGNFVKIDHGYGVETIFAHARSLSIAKGEEVKRGTHIATVGSTGYSTGPHLHYEIRVNGTPVDPLYYILD